MSRNISAETIAAIKAMGFSVYQNPDSHWQTYLFYTDGTRIAYLQNDGLQGLCISTVHVPDKQVGTGYGLGPIPALTRQALEVGFIHAPNWASGADRNATRKFADWAAFERRHFGKLQQV